MKASLKLKMLIALSLIFGAAGAQAQENGTKKTGEVESRATKILGTSARVLFAELSRHERIESHEGMQVVQASGVVCVATDVIAKTNYGCLVGEDGRTPRIPTRTELF